MELFKGEYVSTTMMPAKKDIFGNWIKHHMCGDYYPMNKRIHSDKYAMPLSKEIFDALAHAKAFSTLDLKFGYLQLPLREGDRSKQHFGELTPIVFVVQLWDGGGFF